MQLRQSSTFASLAVPNFRTYVTGALVSNVGTWVQRVAQDWLVLQLSGGSAMAVGITTALQFVPALVLSPFGGVLADRFDKRRLLMFTQSWMALSALVLGALAVSGVAQTWHVYVFAVVFGMGTALDAPARQAFVSEMVGTERLTNAIGLNSSAFNAARLIGPGVAGLIIAAFGSGWAILSNGVSYLAFLIALMLLNRDELVPAEPLRRAKGQVREGVRYVAARADLLIALGVGFAVGTFGLNFQMTNALMVRNEFHLDAEMYGLLGTVSGAGSLLGALLAARRKSSPGLRFVVSAALVFAVVNVLSGALPTPLLYGLVLPLVGLSALLSLTATNMYVQMHVDPQVRGRVMALYMTVLMGGTPIGAPLLGLLAEWFGPRAPLIGGGVIQVAVIAGVLALVAVRVQRGRSNGISGLARDSRLGMFAEVPVAAPDPEREC
ncbi:MULTISPECIES: MFS transporter [Gordonia]|uniref:MFS transporter n=2 Tax=Gordonia TaxID=2053 RepID=A0ABN3HKW8_9ACTN|nr:MULTISPECIES: MFS transporter [Gordonia]AUH68913.1 MFS transporter [Gordonia sp. YC-JH1]MBY4570790.1 MFS transporter [Gordonia sihwensis]GAC59811.1 putative major facilitator superfamily transporter [Gordonia sihwensis NBRC 108236]